MMSPNSLPQPLEWQKAFLTLDRQRRARLNALCIGRRGGKSKAGLYWVMFGPGGIAEGRPCCWGAPTDEKLAEVRSTAKRWFQSVITGPSPGDLGFRFKDGAVLDFWSLSPGHDAFRGRGYSLAVIDEAAIVRNLTEVIEQNLKPALAEYSGRLLLGSTPRGFDEFCQWFNRATREGVTMQGSTALNPRIRGDELEAERRELPELVYRQEILAEFVQLEGVVLRREEVRYGTVPERDQLVFVSFGLDLALSLKKSADQSALAICAGDDRGRRWLVHLAAWRNRWSDTVAKLLGFCEVWKPDIIVLESVAQEGGVASEQLAAYGLPIRAVKPFADKLARWQVIAPRYARGEVWHSDRLDPELEGQILAYPQVRHDDVFDATTYGLAGLDSRTIASLSAHLSPGQRSALQWCGNGYEAALADALADEEDEMVTL